MGHNAITVAIERTVDPDRIHDATLWIQAGINRANRYPGFLGSGWVRSPEKDHEWYMLYRFADPDTLAAWELSEERANWLAEGAEFAQENRVERRTGIEGWFDTGAQLSEGAPVVTPPRWKQAVAIWLGFWPCNFIFMLLVTTFVPFWHALPVIAATLISTLILTPIMTFWVLPFVTGLLQPWLHRQRRSGAAS